ncbi:hypothetical protein GHT06_021524 [Daphnia sinensis]|uniref:Uncharacterized protein n=1 Tax=Daphnia sinensis TaxID=1820382 RepID=A0AAD5PPY7_9CRUS|nr:hypothetical protein GHT06_021524 [Daphnia sinensis]
MDAISTFLLLTLKISPDLLLAILMGIGFFWGMIVQDFLDILFPESIPQPAPESNSNTESIPENPEPTLLDDCTEEPDQPITPDIADHDTENCCECEKLALQAALREWQAAAVKKAMEELARSTSQASFDQKNQSEDSANVNYWRKIYKSDLMRTNRSLTKANQELEDSLAIRKELEHELQLTKNLLQAEQLKAKKVAEPSESRVVVMQNGTEELAKPCEKPKQQTDAATSSLDSASVMDKDFENESSEAKLDGVEKVYVAQLEVPSEQENTTGIVLTEFDQKENEMHEAQLKQLQQERDAALDTMAELETRLDAERREYLQTKEEYEKTIKKLEKGLKESRAYAKLVTSLLVDTKSFWKRNGFKRPKNLKSKTSSGNPSPPKSKLSNMFSKRPTNRKILEINGKPIEMTEDRNCNYACISKVFWEEELKGPLLEPMNYSKWYGNKVKDLNALDIFRGRHVKNKLEWEQVLGFFFAKVKHDGIEYKLPVLVFDKPKTPNFFGRMWLQAFESSDPSFKVWI